MPNPKSANEPQDPKLNWPNKNARLLRILAGFLSRSLGFSALELIWQLGFGSWNFPSAVRRTGCAAGPPHRAARQPRRPR